MALRSRWTRERVRPSDEEMMARAREYGGMACKGCKVWIVVPIGLTTVLVECGAVYYVSRSVPHGFDVL